MLTEFALIQLFVLVFVVIRLEFAVIRV
jgi:hypothetical protein